MDKPTDRLDELNEEFAEAKRAAHEMRACFPDCRVCADDDLQADLEREGLQHDLLNQTLALVYKALERKP